MLILLHLRTGLATLLLSPLLILTACDTTLAFSFTFAFPYLHLKSSSSSSVLYCSFISFFLCPANYFILLQYHIFKASYLSSGISLGQNKVLQTTNVAFYASSFFLGSHSHHPASHIYLFSKPHCNLNIKIPYTKILKRILCTRYLVPIFQNVISEIVSKFQTQAVCVNL